MKKKQMEDSTQQEVETNQGPECEQQKEDIPREEIKSQDDVSGQEEFTKKDKDSTDVPLTKLNALAKKYKDLLFGVSIIFTAALVVVAILDLDRCAPPADLENVTTIHRDSVFTTSDFPLTVEEPRQKGDEESRDPIVNKVIDEAHRLEEAGEIEEAIEKWKSIANVAEGVDNDTAAESWFSIGRLYQKEGKKEKALSAYNKAISLKPELAKAYNNRGVIKKRSGRFEDAIDDYNKAIRLKSDSLHYYYQNRGNAKGSLKEYELAIADFNEAIRLKSDYAEPYTSRAQAQLALGEYESALEDCEESIRLKPDLPYAYTSRGRVRLVLDDIEGAKADFQIALELAKQQDNEDVKVYAERRLQKLNEDADKPEAAAEITETTQAIQQNPDSRLEDRARAEAYRLQNSGKIVEAIEKWQSIAIVAEGVDNNLAADAWFSVAYLYQKDGEEKEALSAYDKVISLKPELAKAYNNRGVVKKVLGRFEDAIKDYDEAIHRNRFLYHAYYNRGNAKLTLKRYEPALEDFDEAIRQKQGYAEAYANRGRAKLDLGNIEEAMVDLQTALELTEQQNNEELKDYIEKQIQRLKDIK